MLHNCKGILWLEVLKILEGRRNPIGMRCLAEAQVRDRSLCALTTTVLPCSHAEG